MRAIDYLWVGLGGGAGALARGAMSGILDTVSIPWGILGANLVGAALLALISVLSHRLSPGQRAMLGTGFCGAFTTVSTLSAQVVALYEGGQAGEALLYLALSLGLAFPLVLWVLRWHPPAEEGAK